MPRRHRAPAKRVIPIDYSTAGPGENAWTTSGAQWIEPYPDGSIEATDTDVLPDARYERREALELAFIAALQHLPARQRAALILRDVLGFSDKEAAGALDTTVPSINGALVRARRAVDRRLPERSQQATLRSLGDRELEAIVERFADAFERGEVDAILSLLAEDATFEMPPHPDLVRGRAAIGRSWLMPGGPPPRLRYLPTSANGQPALGVYQLDRERGSYLPLALDVLTLRGHEVVGVAAFRMPDLFERFGLPDQIPAQAPPRRAKGRRLRGAR